MQRCLDTPGFGSHTDLMKTLTSLCTLLLLAAGLTNPGPAAAGGVSIPATLTITFTNPTDTLDHIWFLYDQGDLNWAYAVPGSAPAGTVTTLSVPLFNPGRVPGAPGFGVAATYGGAVPTGVFVALDAGAAASLVAGGVTFDAAFPSFTGLCSEADLIAALSQSGGCAGFGPQATVNAFGAGAYYANGNAWPFAGTGQLASFTGAGDQADFVRFSTARAGGSVTALLSLVPEPAGGLLWLAGLTVMGFVAARRRN